MAQNLSPQNGPQNICNQNIVHKHGSIFFFFESSAGCVSLMAYLPSSDLGRPEKSS